MEARLQQSTKEGQESLLKRITEQGKKLEDQGVRFEKTLEGQGARFEKQLEQQGKRYEDKLVAGLNEVKLQIENKYLRQRMKTDE